MDISNKKLKKALEHYKNGEYESALKICEKFLEKEYSNEEALALEGDILYKLGRIDDAIVTWKINSEYNNNEEATQRLAAVDKERKELALSYTSIQNMSSEDRILLENAYRENIELKKQVESSDLLKNSSEEEKNIKDTSLEKEVAHETKDFESHTTPIDELPEDFETKVVSLNNIDEPKEYQVVETNLDDIIETSNSKSNEPETIDLEEFKNRIQHLDKVEDSKNNDETDTNKKDETILNEKSSSPITTNTKSHSSKGSSKKKAIIAASVAVIAIIVVVLSYSKLHSAKPPVDGSANTKTSDVTTPTQTATPEATQNTTNTTMLTPEQANEFVSNMQYLISADSIDGVNSALLKTPKASVPESAMPEYEKAENFMKTQGLNYYYTNGMNAYNNNDYLTAIDYFNKAKPYAKDDFRGPTMLFLTAVSYEKLDNTAQAVATYKEFLATYPDAPNYGPESLYFLANYYAKNNNPTEAKQYAQTLATKYPDSMYNNDNIKTILK
ncbi:MAG: tetratricopeptide repeat protein [Sarcina sp.]